MCLHASVGGKEECFKMGVSRDTKGLQNLNRKCIKLDHFKFLFKNASFVSDKTFFTSMLTW